MFRKVLVGIDEETRGRDAIALVLALAADNAEFTLAHVYPAVKAAQTMVGESLNYIQKSALLLASVVDESGLDAKTRWVGAASVGAGLHTIAEEADADLLVVGTTDRSKITRALLGNPTTEALNGSACAVAVAPQGYADARREIQQIGVAYDGSYASEAAVDIARRFARHTGAEVTAFGVVTSNEDSPSPMQPQVERSVFTLSTADGHLGTDDDVEARLACGDPVLTLAGFSHTVDLLVTGSRARDPGVLSHLLQPSTSAALTDISACPLLVITSGARERAVVEAEGVTLTGAAPAAAASHMLPQTRHTKSRHKPADAAIWPG